MNKSIITNMVIFDLIWFFPLLLYGIDMPKAESPLERQRIYDSTFEECWDAILEVVSLSGGTVVTKDALPGLIVFSIIDKETKSKVYMQVYQKKHPSANTVIVNVIPRIRKGIFTGDNDRDFFNNLERILDR